jgi:hypothetical protein
MVNAKQIKSEVVEYVAPKMVWYLKYRTQIWAAVFFVVGAVGGNVDRMRSAVPTLKYDATTIETKLDQIDKMSNQIIKMQETLDKLGVK